MLANKWKKKLQVILKVLRDTKDFQQTYSRLLTLGVISNSNFGVFKRQLRTNILRFFNLDIYIEEDFNKIISGRIDWNIFNCTMSKKVKKQKKSKAQLDQEWEDNVDDILKKYDEEFLRNALKEFMRRERKQNDSYSPQESNKKKTCLTKFLIELGFSNIQSIVISNIAERTYYKRIENNNTRKKRSDALVYNKELIKKVETTFISSENIYGPEKILLKLKEKEGIDVSVSTIYRIKKQQKLVSNFPRKPKYKFKEQKDTNYFAPNYLNENILSSLLPGQMGCADFSVLKIRGEYWHLFVVIDPITTKVLYWEFNKYQTHLSVIRALNALPNLKYFHSDHGLQFRHKDVVALLQSMNIIQSMGRKGVSTDNRPAEVFFNWIKNEYLRPKKFWRLSATNVLEMIERYIKFYNYERISTVFKTNPIVYEQQILNSCKM